MIPVLSRSSSRRRAPASAVASYPTLILAYSPVAYWRLGEASGTTAADASGNGRTGTYNGSPTLGITGAIFGDADTAATFNGSSQFVKRAAAVITGYPLTLECWVYRAANVRTEVPVWVGWDGQTSWTAHYMAIDASGHAEAVSADNNSFAVAITTAVASAGAWHHIVGVFASATSRTIYLDGGNAVGDATNTTPSTIDSTYVASSGVTGATGSRWTGSIDEVAIYNAALTSGQVLANYNRGAFGT